MCDAKICDSFQARFPCISGEYKDHDFGPGPDTPVIGHEDELATRQCVKCLLTIEIDDNVPDGDCLYAFQPLSPEDAIRAYNELGRAQLESSVRRDKMESDR